MVLGRGGCPVCGMAHSACGASPVLNHIVDIPERKKMAEEETTEGQEREPLKRYRIQLEGNRGETVMKLRKGDLERYNVIGPVDAEDDEEESEPAPARKSRTAKNKARTADDK